MTKKNAKIVVQDIPVHVVKFNDEDYISRTDMLKTKDGGVLISKWLSNKNTIEFLGIWEELYNPNFNYTEFGIIMSEAGVNRFTLSVKQWIERTNAIGIQAKTGRYGGSYAHKDIAFELGSWISPKFKLLLIREFQRLKQEENDRLKLEWNLTRTLAKVNYHIHTDAIKENLVPDDLSKQKQSFVYATEADLLNVALFNKTAGQWRNENPDKEGNIRDYATMEQLVVLSNMESMNAELIKAGIGPADRLVKLNQMAISQMRVLIENTQLKKLK